VVLKLFSRDIASIQLHGTKRFLVHVAAQTGSVDMLKYLLEKGCDLRRIDSRKWTPLHVACRQGQAEAIRFLLKHAIEDVEAVDVKGRTPLMQCIKGGYHVACQLLLTEARPNIEHTENQGWRPLHVAAALGFSRIVRALLKQGADCLSSNNKGWTSLHQASFSGYSAVVQQLLDNRRTQAESKSRQSGTASASRVSALVAEYINMKNKSGWAAIHEAAAKGHRDVVRILLKNGAKLQSCLRRRNLFPIQLAAQNGHSKVVALLATLEQQHQQQQQQPPTKKKVKRKEELDQENECTKEETIKKRRKKKKRESSRL